MRQLGILEVPIGTIRFESYNAELTDVASLNRELETKFIGLSFPENEKCIHIDSEANISNFLGVFSLIFTRLKSGQFQITVTRDDGTVIDVTMSSTRVTENGLDITDDM